MQDPQGGEPVAIPVLVEQWHLIDEGYLQVGGAAGVARAHSHAANTTGRKMQQGLGSLFVAVGGHCCCVLLLRFAVAEGLCLLCLLLPFVVVRLLSCLLAG